MRTENLSNVINLVRNNFPAWLMVNCNKEKTLSQFMPNRLWKKEDKELPLYGTYILAWSSSEDVCKEWQEYIENNLFSQEDIAYTSWIASYENANEDSEVLPYCLIIQVGFFLPENV